MVDVKIWFRTKDNREHEQTFRFQTADIAEEFYTQVMGEMLKARRQKLIKVYSVDFCPPLPR